MPLLLALSMSLLTLDSPRNLVRNGDFRNGMRGFSTYYGSARTLLGDGVIWVGKNPTLRHRGAVSIGDHTSGKGAMLLVNGSATGFLPFWQEKLKVRADRHYRLSGWATSWSKNPSDGSATDPSPARLDFKINGHSLGLTYVVTDRSGEWSHFQYDWYSQSETVADIRMLDENLDVVGNDFAVDDLSFQEIVENP
jgi:hypothetical protein